MWITQRALCFVSESVVIYKLCMLYYTYAYGCFLKWWYPRNTPKWSFSVGKPMVVGHHHFRNPPYEKHIKMHVQCSLIFCIVHGDSSWKSIKWYQITPDTWKNTYKHLIKLLGCCRKPIWVAAARELFKHALYPDNTSTSMWHIAFSKDMGCIGYIQSTLWDGDTWVWMS